MSQQPTPIARNEGPGLAETVSCVREEMEQLRRQVAEGFHGVHCRASGHVSKTLETTSFLYALIELLSEHGVVTINELDERKRTVMERQQQRYSRDRIGVILQDCQEDKYTFDRTAEIDCASRVYLCKASCCRLPFALSKQDIEERVVRWNLGVPYMVDQDEDGYCTHHDRCSRGCTIYRERPLPCRGYDCREDKRIWIDFDKRIPNPAIGTPNWLEAVSEQNAAPRETEATH